jgi:hypothetical protein
MHIIGGDINTVIDGRGAIEKLHLEQNNTVRAEESTCSVGYRVTEIGAPDHILANTLPNVRTRWGPEVSCGENKVTRAGKDGAGAASEEGPDKTAAAGAAAAEGADASRECLWFPAL